ncbi:MAG: glycoside hydrolase family 88 protein [Rikenellaceae bacterium]
MKKFDKILLGILTSTALISCSKQEEFIAENFDFAAKQTLRMVETMGENTWFPRTTLPDGSIKYTHANDWTDGFFPGSLWYLYEYTQDTTWRDYAQRWSNAMEKMKFVTWNHDVGFLMYCSFGNGYRLTQDSTMRDVLVQSAKSLSTRFNDTTGCIESWDSRRSWDGETFWDFPVIIDNMMNLELLYFASDATGDSTYRNIATRHALTTLKNHFREDFSSYHVVDYDIHTGEVLARQTCQGFADNSTWARGQAWAIYGFTMVYRFTRDPRFLDAAIGAANYYLGQLPQDKVPYWDFNVNSVGYDPDFEWDPHMFTEQPRDASAAAIVSSALFELRGYTDQYKGQYTQAAIEMLESLASERYRAPLYSNNNFLLMHCTGSLPHGSEIDQPLVYADYYFLEALLRYRDLLRE